jgi:hypothetical protein
MHRKPQRLKSGFSSMDWKWSARALQAVLAAVWLKQRKLADGRLTHG